MFWAQALPYVALLIVMLFFIYAVIGMQVSVLDCDYRLTIFMPPPGDIMFLSCWSVRASVCASRSIVNTISCREFDTFSPNFMSTMHYGTQINASQFGFKRSKVKVTVE